MQNAKWLNNLDELKQQIVTANNQLQNLEVYLFESKTQFCVLTIFDKRNYKTRVTQAINLQSNVHTGLAKGLLSVAINRQKIVNQVKAAA